MNKLIINNKAYKFKIDKNNIVIKYPNIGNKIVPYIVVEGTSDMLIRIGQNAEYVAYCTTKSYYINGVETNSTEVCNNFKYYKKKKTIAPNMIKDYILVEGGSQMVKAQG